MRRGLRRIAKDPYWRLRFRISVETSQPIFKEPIIEWSKDRLNLYSWFLYYKSISEISEGAPAEEIIQDDLRLDSWLNSYNRKQRSERAKSRGGKKTSSGNTINFSRK